MEDLVNFIQKYKTVNLTGWRKWLIGAAVGLASLIVLGIFAYKAFMHNKEVADLKHQRDVLVEQAHQAQVNSQLAQLEADKQTHLDQAQEAMDQVKDIEAHLTTITDEHEKNNQVINSIQSWGDVDRHVK